MTPLLSKAARVLLRWQQTDLARHSGISLTAIKAYENEIRKPRDSTLFALQGALERGGIEFLPNGGLRRTEDTVSVTRFKGADFTRRLNEDVYMSVHNPQEEILTSTPDESSWRAPALRQANNEYMAWCEKTGFINRHKILVPEGDHTFLMPRQTYRLLPREMLGKISYSLYADRLAFILWKKRQVIILRNTAIVETFRNQFTYLWRLAKPV